MALLKRYLHILFFLAIILLTNGERHHDKKEEGEIPSRPKNLCMGLQILPADSASDEIVANIKKPTNKLWTPYKDEKCLLLFKDLLLAYDEAKAFCQNHYSANLISIDHPDKQTFLENFFKFNAVANKVWIGLEYKKNDSYEWSDGAKYSYSNWASGNPKKNSSYCVQMHSNPIGGYGQWADVSCLKKNVVVCEKIQPWSLDYLQTVIFNLRRNPVPVGFIYVQLPKANPPNEIWPTLTWKEVSADYAGVFFRVVGGQAGSFGKVQNASVPRITYIKNIDIKKWKEGLGIVEGEIYMPEYGWSLGIYSGDYYKHYTANYGLKFFRSAYEIRPQNMAIRIWTRVE